MPLVSDPGFLLVRGCVAAGLAGRGAARAVGGDHGARGIGPARRRVALPGLPAAQAGRARGGAPRAGRDARGLRVAAPGAGHAGRGRGARARAAGRGLPRADEGARGGGARAPPPSSPSATRAPRRAARWCWCSRRLRARDAGPEGPRSTRCGGWWTRAPSRAAAAAVVAGAHRGRARTRSTGRSPPATDAPDATVTTSATAAHGSRKPVRTIARPARTYGRRHDPTR